MSDGKSRQRTADSTTKIRMVRLKVMVDDARYTCITECRDALDATVWHGSPVDALPRGVGDKLLKAGAGNIGAHTFVLPKTPLAFPWCVLYILLSHRSHVFSRDARLFVITPDATDVDIPKTYSVPIGIWMPHIYRKQCNCTVALTKH